MKKEKNLKKKYNENFLIIVLVIMRNVILMATTVTNVQERKMKT